MHIETQTTEQTLALGRLIGRLAPNMPAVTCIGLDGPLGAGKTQLTRGIALGAKVADASLVSSPTYVLMNIYEGGGGTGGGGGAKRVYHLDAYRVASAAAFEEIGFGEIVGGETGGGLVVVEWAQRVAEVMPTDTLWVQIAHGGETVRSLDLAAGGVGARALLGQLEAAIARDGLQAEGVS